METPMKFQENAITLAKILVNVLKTQKLIIFKLHEKTYLSFIGLDLVSKTFLLKRCPSRQGVVHK